MGPLEMLFIQVSRNLVSLCIYKFFHINLLAEAMMANEKELVAEISKRCRAKLRLKGKLERGFEEVEVPDDKIPN
jgi:hypothetical protein